jgi:hypothetical protein
MKKFAIITKNTKVKQSYYGEVGYQMSNKTVVWRFLGIPFFRETVEHDNHA